MKVPVRTRRGELTRRKILSAAAVEFGTKGYPGASVRAIARDCGMELALVQYHFGDKLSLWTAMLDDVLRQLRDKSIGTHPPVEGQRPALVLARYIETLIRYAAGNPVFVALMSHARLEGGAYSRALRDYLGANLEHTIETIRLAQLDGEFVKGKPELLFYMIVGSAVRIFMSADDVEDLGVDLQSPATIETQIRTCQALFLPDEVVKLARGAAGERPAAESGSRSAELAASPRVDPEVSAYRLLDDA